MRLFFLVGLLFIVACADSGYDDKDIKALQKKFLQQQNLLLEQRLLINNMLASIEGLEEREVFDIIDPCGDGSGQDEIVLRLDDGSNVAFFETGTKRFLSVLVQGTYTTTDMSACVFSIDNDGMLCDTISCR